MDLDINEEDLKSFPDKFEDLSADFISQVLQEEATEEGKTEASSVQVDFEYLKHLDSQELSSSEEILAEARHTLTCDGTDPSSEELKSYPQAIPFPTQCQTPELPTPSRECKEELWESGTEEREEVSWREVANSLEEALNHTGSSVLPEGITWRHKKRNKRRVLNRKFKKAKLASQSAGLPQTPWNIWAPNIKRELERLPTMVAMNFCDQICTLLRNAIIKTI